MIDSVMDSISEDKMFCDCVFFDGGGFFASLLTHPLSKNNIRNKNLIVSCLESRRIQQP